MKKVTSSQRLNNVNYDIRGPIARKAAELESSGHQVTKLNIGNPGLFGYKAPANILEAIHEHLEASAGYGESKGLLQARQAIEKYYQSYNIKNLHQDDIYIGNGVSELIVMAMQGLIDDGDEILVPSPDYPLWTAAVNLSSGNAKHYQCDEQNGWQPNLEHIKSLITPKTKAIVIINPNNPTGAVYSAQVLKQITETAREHNLIIFSDEIYDQILFDEATHTPIASLSEDLFVVTFNGLSKSYRSAGYRVGWMVFSGNRENARDFINGIETLASMRLCANSPMQRAIAPALNDEPTITEFLLPKGRLYEQRNLAHSMLNEIPGITCELAKGALYLFPKIDTEMYGIKDDQEFILDFLEKEKVLLVQGSGFNWPKADHFRIVFLASSEELANSINKLAKYLKARLKSRA